MTFLPRFGRPLALALAALYLAACSLGNDTSDAAGNKADTIPPDEIAPGDEGQPNDIEPADAPPALDVAQDAAAEVGDAAGDTAGDAVQDLAMDVGDAAVEVDNGPLPPPLLTPEEIGYEAAEPTWSGSVIYFNTWNLNGGKDEIWMMRPEDPAGRKVRMKANRVWTFGVAPDGTIAFASADPRKDTNYPDLANLSDAIQYTWLLRPGQAPVQVSNGRVNDECHVFLPDSRSLILCRRANFARVGEQVVNDPYRIVRLDLATLTDAFLTPLQPQVLDLNAYPRDDGVLLFSRIYGDTGESALWTMNGDGTNPALALDGANRAVLSQDGKTAWFKKSGSNATWQADSHQLDGATVTNIGNGKAAEGIVPSPDGTQVAFEVRDNAGNCSDVYVSGTDGSGQQLLIDCSVANLFISGMRWIRTDDLPVAGASSDPFQHDASSAMSDAEGPVD